MVKSVQRHNAWCAAAAAGLLVLALGCASTIDAARTPVQMNAELMPRLVFRPGDVIDLKFFQAPELNENVTVLPDGTIHVQLIGTVLAEGKTVSELKDELFQLYAFHLKVPEVAVIPRTLNASRVFVGGEVIKPGAIPMPGTVTALQAIIEAGGFKADTAEVASVVVIRNRDGKQYGCSLDLRDALAGRETEPFYLQQNDVVFVPRTTIVNVDLFVDQYLNKLIPDIGFEYIYLGEHHRVGVSPRN